jgi:hypothetical protein
MKGASVPKNAKIKLQKQVSPVEIAYRERSRRRFADRPRKCKLCLKRREVVASNTLSLALHEAHVNYCCPLIVRKMKSQFRRLGHYDHTIPYYFQFS